MTFFMLNFQLLGASPPAAPRINNLFLQQPGVVYRRIIAIRIIESTSISYMYLHYRESFILYLPQTRIIPTMMTSHTRRYSLLSRAFAPIPRLSKFPLAARAPYPATPDIPNRWRRGYRSRKCRKLD